MKDNKKINAITNLLIDRGVDYTFVSIDEVDKITPFVDSCLRGNIDIVLYFLDEKHVDVNDYYGGFSALWNACQEGHVDVAKLLLDRGANVDMVGSPYGMMAIFAARSNGHLDIMKLLDPVPTFQSASLCVGDVTEVSTLFLLTIYFFEMEVVDSNVIVFRVFYLNFSIVSVLSHLLEFAEIL